MSLCDSRGLGRLSPTLHKLINANPLRKMVANNNGAYAPTAAYNKDTVEQQTNRLSIEDDPVTAAQRKLSAPALSFRNSGVYVGACESDLTARRDLTTSAVELYSGDSTSSTIPYPFPVFSFESPSSATSHSDNGDAVDESAVDDGVCPHRKVGVDCRSLCNVRNITLAAAPKVNLPPTAAAPLTPRVRRPSNNGGHFWAASSDEHLYQHVRRSRSLANGDDADRIPDVDKVRHRATIDGDESLRKSSQPIFTQFSFHRESSNGKKQAVHGEIKKKRSFAEPIAKKLNFLRRRPTDSFLVTNSGTGGKPSPEDIKWWAQSFDKLLGHKYGVMLFRVFLQREFSEENIEFWLACEEYKKISNQKQQQQKAKQIYVEYVAVQSSKEVNLDSVTRATTLDNLETCNKHTFDQAQHRIQSLMAKDSYPRFLRSDLYLDLLQK